VTFQQVGEKVRVSANVSGLKPNAEHGFHVHEKGDCGSGDGMSAGGHYNPRARPTAITTRAATATPATMPNLRSDAYGNAQATFETSGTPPSEAALPTWWARDSSSIATGRLQVAAGGQCGTAARVRRDQEGLITSYT
jgi:Cu/Zn superoxide dismutase